MKKINKRPTTRKSKSSKGTAIMAKAKVVVPVLLVVCALVIGTLIVMGPKQSLQTPPIEPKAMAYITAHNFLGKDEKITGYKAISYYNYDKAAVVTNKRIFIYDKTNVFSIPLNKITQVVIKESDIGQEQILITAQTYGMITFDLYHSSVEKLVELLGVPKSIVRNAKEIASDDTTVGHTGKI